MDFLEGARYFVVLVQWIDLPLRGAVRGTNHEHGGGTERNHLDARNHHASRRLAEGRQVTCAWVALDGQTDTETRLGPTSVNAVKIGLQVLLVLSSLLLTLLVLLHKGKGGGLSDMFGGGMSTTMSGSSVAERNLDRFTVALGLVWGATIVGLGLIERFSA